MNNHRCLHTKTFTICLINCRLEQTPLHENPQNDVERQAMKTGIRCGIATFSAGLSAPMGLYDLDSGQYIGRVGIPDEVVGTRVPQSFCDPDDGLELELVGE